jgi:predicted signal transduction protein with EAL and GGDEF domain
MDKIRRLVERTLTTDSGDPITVSIGVSEVSFAEQLELQKIQEELIQRADESLYSAKRSGRNRFVLILLQREKQFDVETATEQEGQALPNSSHRNRHFPVLIILAVEVIILHGSVSPWGLIPLALGVTS